MLYAIVIDTICVFPRFIVTYEDWIWVLILTWKDKERKIYISTIDSKEGEAQIHKR